MKKKILCFVLLILFACGSYAIAAEKIGFIDMKDILLLSDAGKEAAKEFQKAFEKSRTEIQRQEAQLKKVKDDLEKQKQILTEQAMQEKELSYQKRFRDYKRLVEDANAEIKRKDQELRQRMLPEILEAVNEIGKKGGYTMILDFGAGGMAYHSKDKDITKQVIEEYNKIYKSNKK
jgi:outer membrane protein